MAAVIPQTSPTAKYVPPQARRSAGLAPALAPREPRRHTASISTNWRAPTASSNEPVDPQERRPISDPPRLAAGPNRGLHYHDLSYGDIIWVPKKESWEKDWLARPASTNKAHLPYGHPAVVISASANVVKFYSITSFDGRPLGEKYPSPHVVKERYRYRFISHPAAEQKHEHPDGIRSINLEQGTFTKTFTKPSYINVSDEFVCQPSRLSWFVNGKAQNGLRIGAASLCLLERLTPPASPANSPVRKSSVPDASLSPRHRPSSRDSGYFST